MMRGLFRLVGGVVVVVGLGDAVPVVVAGVEVVVRGVPFSVCSEVVTCSEVLSWARAGLVRTEVSRLVSSHPTHIMSGVMIARAKTRAFVEGLCHRKTRYLLVGQVTHSMHEQEPGPAAGSPQGWPALKPYRDATDDEKMRDHEGGVDPQRSGARSAGDFTFIVFSLRHAGCGEQGVIELRLEERLLLGWCPACAVLETVGSLEG